MLCFIIDLINVEFVGGAKRRATASKNNKILVNLKTSSYLFLTSQFVKSVIVGMAGVTWWII
jgi:hypothetical protein